jgi:hypothetical protein
MLLVYAEKSYRNVHTQNISQSTTQAIDELKLQKKIKTAGLRCDR